MPEPRERPLEEFLPMIREAEYAMCYQWHGRASIQVGSASNLRGLVGTHEATKKRLAMRRFDVVSVPVSFIDFRDHIGKAAHASLVDLWECARKNSGNLPTSWQPAPPKWATLEQQRKSWE
jgi:hypothetical protein